MSFKNAQRSCQLLEAPRNAGCHSCPFLLGHVKGVGADLGRAEGELHQNGKEAILRPRTFARGKSPTKAFLQPLSRGEPLRLCRSVGGTHATSYMPAEIWKQAPFPCRGVAGRGWTVKTAGCIYDAIIDEDESDNKHLIIGFDRNANPFEIMYNVIDEDTISIFHAMKCRKKYVQFIKTRGEIINPKG